VTPGSRLPLVPAHQVKAGGLTRLGAGVSLGLDARYTGRQWLRGDEANVTTPLHAYTVTNARVGLARGGWETAAMVSNLFDAHDARFGTFNENRRTGTLERFLTALGGRAVKLIVRREIGPRARDGGA
jgi:iron complex outermembrane receptor protein